MQLGSDQTVEHGGPRRIEVMRGCGRTPPRNAVGLLDERDAHSQGVCDSRHGGKVLRLHPATGTVTKDEPARGSSAPFRYAFAVPDGVSISIVFTGVMLPRRLNPGGAAP